MTRFRVAVSALLLLVAPAAPAAEVPFTPQSSISTGLDPPVDAPSADLDGDGDLDVVFSSRDTNLVGWLENTGAGFTQRSIESQVAPTSAAVADLDADGDLDVAVTSDSQNRVRWYRSDGASPPGFTGSDVSTTAEGALEVAIADMDRDGDLDLISVAKDDDEVAWFENDGGSPPGFTRRVIDEDPDASGSGADGTVNGPAGVVVFDPDRDGDPDVAVIGLSVLAWFENANGAGTSWSPHTAASGLATGTEIASGDLDRDGDPDLVVAVRGDDAVYWYENDGTPGTGTWTQRTALSGVDFGTGGNVSVGDVDVDGDVDVLAGSVDQKLFWADSDGGSPPVFTTRELTGQLPIIHPAAADYDGDGDADLLARNPSDDQLRWLRNDSIHRSAAFPAQNTIDAAADFPSWVAAADLDRDGDQDAMIINAPVTGGAGIRWRENTDGAGTFGPASLIASAFVARVIRVGDLDRDGDPDLVTASTPGATRLSWHENTAGDASNWTTQFISSTYPSPFCADIGDIDGDGDFDVIAGSSADGNSSLAWFENTAGDASAWSQRAISAVQYFPSEVRLADVDGDGDLDAFYTEVGFATIAWKENTAGDGSAWSDHIIENGMSTIGPNTVEPADMDGDGDTDVVVASRGSNNSAWFENANGAGTSWTRHSLTSPARLYRLRATDLDRDGDVDVVGSGELEDRLSVFENLNGDGTSWDHTWTPEWLDQPLGLDAADLDGDGDDDLLAVGFASNEVISVENQGGQFALRTTGKNYQGMVDGRKLDVLLIDATHRGRAGDSDAEIADFELRFEDEFGVPLTSGQANALLSQVRFYLDNGNRTFEDGVDTPLLTAGPLTLDSGVEHFTPADGDADHQLAAPTSKAYFVVATLQATASSASPKRFQVVHLTQSGSDAEDRSNDLPLSLEAFPDTGSEVIEALPTTGDADADGLSNVDEADVYASDPLDVDTDADALEDGDEVNTHGTSPINNDSDDDGLGDGAELSAYGTDPLDPDSEDDGYCDGPFSPGGCTAGDNCPAVSNAPQTNGDAYAAGDLCQCGNVDGAGGITSADYTLAREAVIKDADPSFDADFCDVNGDAACDVEDLAILDRVVNAQSATVLDACPGYQQGP
jgi:hypothetical protein